MKSLSPSDVTKTEMGHYLVRHETVVAGGSGELMQCIKCYLVAGCSCTLGHDHPAIKTFDGYGPCKGTWSQRILDAEYNISELEKKGWQERDLLSVLRHFNEAEPDPK